MFSDRLDHVLLAKLDVHRDMVFRHRVGAVRIEADDQAVAGSSAVPDVAGQVTLLEKADKPCPFPWKTPAESDFQRR